MTETFRYYDDWKSATLECPRCGWKGTFEEGDVEYYDALFDCSCPRCDTRPPMLAIVSYPTTEETEENWDKLSDSEKQRFLERKQWRAEYEAAKLTSPDQLPDISGATVSLFWDFERGAMDHRLTIIRHGDTEIWRELCGFECYKRYAEVVEILKEKYGERLVDVEPTSASETYLYGDRLSALDFVRKIRKSLKQGTD